MTKAVKGAKYRDRVTSRREERCACRRDGNAGLNVMTVDECVSIGLRWRNSSRFVSTLGSLEFTEFRMLR